MTLSDILIRQGHSVVAAFQDDFSCSFASLDKKATDARRRAVPLVALCSVVLCTNKNSSGDEIANVNFLTTISHTRSLLQNTGKETNLLRLTN